MADEETTTRFCGFCGATFWFDSSIASVDIVREPRTCDWHFGNGWTET